jgi:hypothetical protein
MTMTAGKLTSQLPWTFAFAFAFACASGCFSDEEPGQ